MSNPVLPTRERVLTLVASVVKQDPGAIRGADRLREDLGMDSLASLDLLSRIGDELDVDIELDDAMGLETVDQACAFVERVLADQHAAVAQGH